jgi:hypothetical protein
LEDKLEPNPEQKPEEMKFPRSYTVCPNCGSTRRIIESIGNEEKALHKIQESLQVGVQFGAMAITDPNSPAARVPVVNPRFDICYDCGTFYCVFVEKQIAQTQIAMPGQGPFGGRPGGRPGFPPGFPGMNNPRRS